MFFGMIDDDYRRKIDRSAKTAARRGPKLKKEAIFAKILKLGIFYDIWVLNDPKGIE